MEHNKFNAISPGTLLKSDSGDYFLKIEQLERQTCGMVANLFTGELIHHSFFNKLTPVFPNEIMW